MRFRQCMTRGMTLIKMHLITKLRALSAEVMSKKPVLAKGESIKPAMATALYYVKFRTIAPPLRSLVSELEKRCVSHKEYVSSSKMSQRKLSAKGRWRATVSNLHVHFLL